MATICRLTGHALPTRCGDCRGNCIEQLGMTVAALEAWQHGFECQDCLGMKEHGCYCAAVGAIAPGGPLPPEEENHGPNKR
jgi:hypothetical protein